MDLKKNKKVVIPLSEYDPNENYPESTEFCFDDNDEEFKKEKYKVPDFLTDDE